MKLFRRGNQKGSVSTTVERFLDGLSIEVPVEKEQKEEKDMVVTEHKEGCPSAST